MFLHDAHDAGSPRFEGLHMGDQILQPVNNQ